MFPRLALDLGVVFGLMVEVIPLLSRIAKVLNLN